MARLSIWYHPAARREAYDALDWYLDRSPFAADRLQKELEKAQVAISETPHTWSEYLYGTRRYKLKRFQFVVVYRVMEHQIQIIAVAHGSRKPGYWADRLTSPQ